MTSVEMRKALLARQGMNTRLDCILKKENKDIFTFLKITCTKKADFTGYREHYMVLDFTLTCSILLGILRRKKKKEKKNHLKFKLNSADDDQLPCCLCLGDAFTNIQLG